MDRWQVGFGAAHALGQLVQAVAVGAIVGRAGVDVGLFAGAGERDVGAFAGGVLADDQVRGVGGLALGGERVLDVGEPQVCPGCLLAVERDGLAVGQRQRDGLGVGIDVGDLRGRAVAQLAVLGVVDGVADLDLVAGMQRVWPAGNRDRLGSELAVLVADRLGAGVELVEVLV